MKMFIFEDVLKDYTSGMVVVVGNDYDDVMKMVKGDYPFFVDDEDGWKNPTVYNVDNNTPPGIKHVMWGGS